MAWLLDTIFGADDLQSKGDELDAKLAEMNARDYGPGGKFYTPSNWAHVQQNLETGKTGDVSAQLEEAFDEGWEEGKGNVTGFVGKIFGVAGDIIGSVLKGIPWWVWAGLILWFGWPFIAPLIARKAAGR